MTAAIAAGAVIRAARAPLRWQRPAKGALGLLLLLAAWQGSVPLVGLEPYFYPSPLDVWHAFLDLVA